MQCPECQAELREDEDRCRFCGASVPAVAPPLPAEVSWPREPPAAQSDPADRPASATGPVPGANLALASLIVSLAGTVVCGCLAPVGAVLGYRALRALPVDAASSLRWQARLGFWIGAVVTALLLLVGLVFGLVNALL